MKFWAVAAPALACGCLLGGLAVASLNWVAATESSAPVLAEVPSPGSDEPVAAPIYRVSPANYEAEEPPRRLDEGELSPPPDSPKHAAVRDVVDRLLRDATPEEREIFFEELKNLPPGIVEDLLNVRRHFGPTQPRPHAGPPSLAEQSPSRLVPPSVDILPSGPWTDAIRAMQRARDIHLHNLANVNTPGFRRLEPVSNLLPSSGDVASPSLGSRWEGTRIDERIAPVSDRSNVDPEIEWRAIEQIDRWLNAVAR